MEKIIFQYDDETIEFYVLEQTRINGRNYLLVTEEEDGDAEALILKDISADDDKEAIYEVVEDDEEISYIAKIFSEILDDIDLQ